MASRSNPLSSHRRSIAFDALREFVVAKKTTKKAAKKTAKKSAKKARKTSARAGAKASAAKKRANTRAKAKKGVKRGAKKSAKAPKKTVAKKAPKKTSKKASKETPKKASKPAAGKAPKKAKAAKPGSTSHETHSAVAPPLSVIHTADIAVEAKPQKAPRATSRVAPSSAPAAKKNSFYITTAIAYPNGNPHIGHAYKAIATDALARFQRLDGKDVFFLTGTDEHGLKMIQTAQAEGLTPSELAERNAGRFKDMDQRLDISFDRFIRTTEEQHHRSSQEIWRRMAENGDIYLDSYAGWYSVRDEAYYAEDETKLGEDNVRRGPQGTPVEWVEENSYFFRLSAYQDRLLALYDSQPDFIGPDSRKNEVVSFVKGGLRDLSISRTTFDWGVKVPGDPEHVMYVWVD